MISLENKVLVLGHDGMLGHVVKRYLEENTIKVETTPYKFRSDRFKNAINSFNGNYIINCIGAIPQKTNNFDVNYSLPIFLDLNTDRKIIHPGTDCEMDNDPYGLSKKKASDYVKDVSKNTKILKTSIIGPELKSKKSLMEWFLTSTGEVNGFSEVFWNGVTTLEWSKNLLKLINNWEDFNKETILYTKCISKYELLELIKKVFNKKITVKRTTGISFNKCLEGDINTGSIEDQLYELKNWYY